MTALREVSNLKSSTMSKGQAEVVLQNFVANGWLMKSEYVTFPRFFNTYPT